MNFKPHRRDDLEINMTPLIDVVFLLLIFFMVSTTFQKESELQVQLPQASTEPMAVVPKSVEIVINDNGQYFVDGKELINRKAVTLRQALQRVTSGRKDTPIVLRADARTPHQAVVTAMDVAARLGLKHLSIATSHKSE